MRRDGVRQIGTVGKRVIRPLLALSQLPHHVRYSQTWLFQYVRLALFHPILSRHNRSAFFTVIVVFAIIVVRYLHKNNHVVHQSNLLFPAVGHIRMVNCTLWFQLSVHN